MEKELECENVFDAVIEGIDSLETEPDRHLSIQIDNELRACIKACKASGKPASLAVKIKVAPAAERRVTFSGQVTATLPKAGSGQVTLYADEDGGIHKRDPLQQLLDFDKKKGERPKRKAQADETETDAAPGERPTAATSRSRPQRPQRTTVVAERFDGKDGEPGDEQDENGNRDE